MKNILSLSIVLLAALSAGSSDEGLKSHKHQSATTESIHIYGTGYGLPFNHNPETLIEAYLNIEEPPVGFTTSNPDGSYSLNIIVNNVQEIGC